MVLFNNKEILVGGKPVFIREWFGRNILSGYPGPAEQQWSATVFSRIYQQILLQYEFPPILSSYHCNCKVFSINQSKKYRAAEKRITFCFS